MNDNLAVFSVYTCHNCSDKIKTFELFRNNSEQKIYIAQFIWKI